MVAPIGTGFIKYSGQVIIIMSLMYILFKNFTETHNFSLIQKNMEKDKIKRKEKKMANKETENEKDEPEMDEDTRLDLQNNTIASYVLCVFILILLIYVIYSLFD
jgi:Ca2+/H+ antiporter